ncbi:ABC transporter ATP-binding protein [Candidatus Synechococcus spongiarum]|uniref:Phospholipid-lipopolysaccharide ABC transporter n=1 Tax=Candidatus Synechococcus spongiarum TaxID=431041 RepID=A0A170TEW5_9SYNE|nr:ABC transporter ATP-binding protein [Candidatus Synechococcus spongiarum]CZB22020.1 Phospholipid-lipopolysaccharide ABC transporter [Candidatus Synechococcus spongiarum]
MARPHSGVGRPSPPPIFRLIAPIKSTIVAACVVQAVGSLAGIVPFIGVVEIARALLAGDDASGVVRIAWIAAGALALRVFCFVLSGMLTHMADNDLQLRIRRGVAARLSRVPLCWFTVSNGGALKKGMQDDVTTMHTLVAHTFTSLTAALITPLGALAYLASINPVLVPVALIPLVIGMVFYMAQMRNFGEKMVTYQESLAAVNGAAVEYVHGIGVIKTFSGTDRAFSRFVCRTGEFIDFFWNWAKGLLNLAVLTDLVLSPLTGVVVTAGLGLWLVADDVVMPVDALALVVLAPALTGTFLAFSFEQDAMMQGGQAARRLVALLDTPVLSTPAVPRKLRGHRVVFQGVHATYDGKREVLSEIDLVLEPGSTTALVGPSGSGKSTMAQLLPRFLDPSAGQVTLGGVPLPEIAPEELYRHIGFVFQDVQLLRASVRDNIALGVSGSDRRDVERVARAARIHERILSLPDGYDTMLGAGTTLSSGESQRITIARALLADPPILVLDEAMAFADPETGTALREALATWSSRRTLLIVAHNLATVVHADQICVLEEGRIAQRGNHAELVADRDGLYAALWAAAIREDVK